MKKKIIITLVTICIISLVFLIYKNKIYNKKIDVLLSLLVLFIPLLITYFVICSQFSVVV